MKKYAVAYINFLDFNLKMKIVVSDGGWKGALENAFIGYGCDLDLPDDIENAKDCAYEKDWIFEVVEID